MYCYIKLFPFFQTISPIWNLIKLKQHAHIKVKFRFIKIIISSIQEVSSKLQYLICTMDR